MRRSGEIINCDKVRNIIFQSDDENDGEEEEEEDFVIVQVMI